MLLRNARPVNIGMLFDWHAEQSRQTVLQLDRPFDIAPGDGTTFDGAMLANLVRETTGWLHAAGLRHGDRIAIVKDNHYDTLLIAAAAARMGALPAMLAPSNAGQALRAMIERLKPTTVVVSPSVLDRTAAEDCPLSGPGVRTVVLGEPASGLPADAVCIADVRGSGEAPVRVRDNYEPLIITHTSGTTGVPKLVVHSANSSLASFPFRLESHRLPLVTSRRSDVVAGALSFAHNRVLSWTASQLNLTPQSLVIISDPTLDNTTRMFAEHRPTSVETCPNIFQWWEQLAHRTPELFHRTRLFVSAFDAIHPRTVRTFLGVSRRRFPVWAWGLGQSEIAGISMNVITRWTVSRRGATGSNSTNVGWPILVRIRVIDPATERKQARGKPGLLTVATRSRCLTYLGEDDRYQAKARGKWWNSGDLGVKTGFGRIRLVDREVDTIPGISCIELESTLLDRLDRATEVVVLGVPSGLPIPVLCMHNNDLDPAEWRQATLGLPPLGRPRVVPWKDVPRTATWKVCRDTLRKQLLGANEVLGTGKWT